MDYSWLTQGSLIIGIIALALPIFNLTKADKSTNRIWIILSLISLGACATSVCMQVFYFNHLVSIKDWAAIMDTFSVVAFIATSFMVATIALNIVTFIAYRKKVKK